jgi:hypothetical protein
VDQGDECLAIDAATAAAKRDGSSIIG